jgi:hypothetical protein
VATDVRVHDPPRQFLLTIEMVKEPWEMAAAGHPPRQLPLAPTASAAEVEEWRGRLHLLTLAPRRVPPAPAPATP